MKRILSLGAGVQSTTMLLMSIKGELPKLDYAVFADTGWEPKAVYDQLAWLTDISEEAGIPVHVVSKEGMSMRDALHDVRTAKNENKYVRLSLPLWTKDHENLKVGKMRFRHCTGQYKIQVVERFVKKELGIFGKRLPNEVLAEMWLGISTDEVKRAKVSATTYLDNRFPFITDVRMSRGECLQWLERNYPDKRISRSACIGCPYRDNFSWREIRENPEEWADALMADEQVRSAYDESTIFNGADVYLHHSGVPLKDADLNDPEFEQTDWINECTGMCGL